MADSLIIPETQKFYDIQAQEANARKFANMLFAPDKDGNLGIVTDVTAVPRVQYNDGSSTRIHTSEDFNFFLQEFIKDNADELFSRTMMKAAEMLKEQQLKAAAEVNSQLDLSVIDPSGVGPTIPAPIITSPLLATSHVGEAFTYYIIAAHSNIDPSAPTTFDAKNLPEGLTLDPVTGIISGTVAQAGMYPITIIAKNVAGKDQKVLQLAVAQISQPPAPPTPQPTPVAPTIYGGLSASAKEGDPFTFQCNASNLPAGNNGVTWSATGLPADLTIDPTTGEISGTPAVDTNLNSPYSVTLKVEAPDGTDTETLTLTVSA